MKNEEKLTEVFSFEAQEFPQTNLPSVFIDRLLGRHFESPHALVNGLNLDVNALNDEDRVIPIFVKPDGTWSDGECTFVLEVKTVKRRELISKHMEDYLRQVAAYQLLQYEDPDSTPESRYLLIFIILENPERPQLLVFEVLFQNLRDCAAEWKKWFKNLDTLQAFKVDRLIAQHRTPVSIASIRGDMNDARREAGERARLRAEKEARKRSKAEARTASSNVFTALRAT